IMLMAALVAAPVAAQDAPVPAGLTVDRVVLLMRHGVRPPTKAPPMPAGTADRPGPAGPVAPGYLTPHGRTAIARVAAYDRARWSAAGLVAKTGCTPVRIASARPRANR
ncbi:hypothetical protein LZC13_10130, partial [Campylobacter coli]|nr:hypothetical protein [Campylobacter coli]